MSTKKKIGILGASGYTGAELVRLLLRHPKVEIALLTADRRAGQAMGEVFPQFAPYRPADSWCRIDSVDWAAAGLDLVFCALPHATTQKVLQDLLAKAPQTKVVDLSADFRLPIPRPMPNGTATSITRWSCSRRRSTAWSRSIGATSRRRGWSPIPAATRPARSCRSCRCSRPRRSSPTRS